MGWLELIAKYVNIITEAIESGLRAAFGLPEEIAAELPPPPSTVEEIEAAMEAAEQASRFVREITLEEAQRLARGVPFYERLTNVARMRHWTVADPFTTAPPPDAMWSVRVVVVGPDGEMCAVDVRGKVGQPLDRDEFIRAAASALPDEFVERYKGVGRSEMIREWVVAQETYVERFKRLR